MHLNYIIKVVFCATLLLLCVPSYAAAQMTIEWEATFDKTPYDYANYIQQTKDGGFIIIGITEDNDDKNLNYVISDIYIIKTNSQGKKEWDKTIGGPKEDRGVMVKQTQDGGYVVLGATESFGNGCEDIYVAKLTPKGDTVWEKTFGGTKFDWPKFVHQTSDGGFVIAGAFWASVINTTIKSSTILFKLDSSGNKEWEKIFDEFECTAAKETLDGGYIIGGNENSENPYVPFYRYIMKVDSNGNKIWSKAIDSGSFDDILPTKEGGYVIAGTGGLNWNFCLLKIDSQGNKIWGSEFSENTDTEDHCLSVQTTNDGGYILIGYSVKYWASSPSDIHIIKTDSNGKKVWGKFIGNDNENHGQYIQQTKDGGYILLSDKATYNPLNRSIQLIKFKLK